MEKALNSALSYMNQTLLWQGKNMYIYSTHAKPPKNAKEKQTNRKPTNQNQNKYKWPKKHRKEGQILKKMHNLASAAFHQPCHTGMEWGCRYCSGDPAAVPIHLVFQLWMCPWPLSSSGEPTRAQPMTWACFLWSTVLTEPGKLRGSSRHFAVSCSDFPGRAISQREKKIRALFCPSLWTNAKKLWNSYRIRPSLDVLRKFN